MRDDLEKERVSSALGVGCHQLCLPVCSLCWFPASEKSSCPFTCAVIPGNLSRTVKRHSGAEWAQELFDLDTSPMYRWKFYISLSLWLVFSQRRIWTWIGALCHVLWAAAASPGAWMTPRRMRMKTVGTAPGGGEAALVGFPMKSSKCKFILLRGTKLSFGFWLLLFFWFFLSWVFFYGLYSIFSFLLIKLLIKASVMILLCIIHSF